jgi:hypothetical protein
MDVVESFQVVDTSFCIPRKPCSWRETSLLHIGVVERNCHYDTSVIMHCLHIVMNYVLGPVSIASQAASMSLSLLFGCQYFVTAW